MKSNFSTLIILTLLATIGCASRQTCPPGMVYVSHEKAIHIVQAMRVATIATFFRAERCQSPLGKNLIGLANEFSHLERAMLDGERFDNAEAMKLTHALAEYSARLKNCDSVGT